MVGRASELELLSGMWRRAATAAESEGVMLVGEPGIGKSRLVRALCDTIDNGLYARLVYQCSPYHTDTPLWPVIEHLRTAANFADTDSVDDALDKVESMLSDSHETQERREDLLLLADLLDLDASERGGPLSLGPQEQRVRTMQCLVGLIKRRAARQPVLVCFEDLHWIDPTSLELLELALEQTKSSSILFLLTSRPEGQPQRGAMARLARLELSRLGKGSAAQLVRDIIPENTSLPESVIGELIARADGVPLFVEELTKAILDGPREGREPGGPASAESVALEIPSSLAGSLMARLDRLEGTKEVAQIAACIGREFDERLLAAVVDRGHPLVAPLEHLCTAGLVFRRAASTDRTYVFKHALVRDAIYESCLKSRRKQLHTRVARALVKSSYSTPETIAVHFLAADEGAEALPYILAAANNAVGRYAYLEANRWFEKGAEVIPRLLADQVSKQRLELDLYVAWMPILMAIKGFSDQRTLAVAQRGDVLCHRLGATDRLLPMLFGQMGYFGAGGGNLNSALEIATRIQHLGESSGDPTASLVGSRAQGFCYLWMARLKEAEVALLRAIQQAPRAPSGLALQFGTDPEITSLIILGSVQQRLGRIDAGGDKMRTALKKAQEFGHPLTYAWVLRHFSVSAAAIKDYVLVEKLAAELTDVCSKYEIRQFDRLGPLMRSWAVLRRTAGSSDTTVLEGLLEEHRARNYRRNLPFYMALVAEVLLDQESFSKAAVLIEQAHGLMQEMNEYWLEPELLGLRARMFAGTDSASLGKQEQLLILSQTAARKQGARIADLRATTSLARLWRSQGKGTEARGLLLPVYGGFAEGFETDDLKEAASLLDEL